MNLMQISFAVLSFGMILGFLAVVFSILFQMMERKAVHDREVSTCTGYFQKVAKVRTVGVLALYSSAGLVLLGLVMLAISIKVIL